MEESKEERKIESLKDISAAWIKNNVYEALETIEQCERRMRNGCIDLMEYIQMLGQGGTIMVQVKNMEIMITELDILIENTKRLLKSEQYKEVRKELDEYNKLCKQGIKKEGKIIFVTKIRSSEPRNKKIVILTELFYLLEGKLCKLRSKMVDNLQPILFATKKEREEREI